MSQEYYDRFPGRRAFKNLIDLTTAEVIPTGSLSCHVVKLGGVLDVAIHITSSGFIYVRALDFTIDAITSPKESEIWTKAFAELLKGRNPEGSVAEIIIRNDINNFVASFERSERSSLISRNLLTQFRHEVQDDSATVAMIIVHGRATLAKRANQNFIALEVLPHMLSRFGIFDSPPDPAWEPVWDVIRRMEPLAGCPMLEPRARVAVEKKVSASEKADRLRKPQHVDKEGETSSSEGEGYMQMRKSEMAKRIRLMEKTIRDLQAKEKKYVETNPAQVEIDALRNENSKIRHKLKVSQEAEAQAKGQLILAERESTDRERIIDAMNLDVKPLTEKGRKTIKSYQATYKNRSLEEVIDSCVDREYVINLALRAMEEKAEELAQAKSRLDQAGIKPVSSVEIQTELSWNEVNPLTTLPLRVGNETPATRGREAEDRLQQQLIKLVPANCTVVLTRFVGYCGDYVLLFREADDDSITGYAIIDCKSRSTIIPSKEVEKLIGDVDKTSLHFKSPPRWAAIVSTDSDIAYNGVTPAQDFCHGTSQIILLHSTRSLDDGSLAIQNLLKMSDTLAKIPITAESRSLLEKFERDLNDAGERRRGRGFSRSRIGFRAASRSVAARGFVQVEEPIITEKAVKPERPARPVPDASTGQEVEGSHDTRIFVSKTGMTPANIKIVKTMSKLFRYQENSQVKGLIVRDKLADTLKVQPSYIAKALKEILADGVRQGHCLKNLVEIK